MGDDRVAMGNDRVRDGSKGATAEVLVQLVRLAVVEYDEVERAIIVVCERGMGGY